ncbi:MAG: hypothetical protein FNNCIFGK_00617 [Bacteroidia bacterium]|nr:hypothetical protein [Bacteroidia bacterium]
MHYLLSRPPLIRLQHVTPINLFSLREHLILQVLWYGILVMALQAAVIMYHIITLLPEVIQLLLPQHLLRGVREQKHLIILLLF